MADNKILKEKYNKLKNKFIQNETKWKGIVSENEKLKEEKLHLQEKNHVYLQDATRLQQLSEEMKDFETQVFTKKIGNMEKQILALETENKTLRVSSQISASPPPVYKAKPKTIEARVDRMLKENHQLVLTMQSALESVKICDFDRDLLREDREIKELISKMERFMAENDGLRGELKEKESEIRDLKERIERINASGSEKLLEERIKNKDNEIHSLEIKIKYLEESDGKLKSQLQEALQNIAKVQEISKAKDKELEEIQGLRNSYEEIQYKNEKIRIELELEKDLRNQYFISLKELEAILKEMMNEGELYRNNIQKTVSEETRKTLEKYRLVVEEKTTSS